MGCVTCSSAPTPSHWTEARVLTGRRCNDGNPPAQGRALGLVVAVKRAPLGSSSTCTIPSISSCRKHPSVPRECRIQPQASKQRHTQRRWLFTQWVSAAPGSSLSCIRRYASYYREKKKFLRTKEFTGKILACRFSEEVRLGLLCKWPRIRSDYQDWSSKTSPSQLGFKLRPHIEK